MRKQQEPSTIIASNKPFPTLKKDVFEKPGHLGAKSVDAKASKVVQQSPVKLAFPEIKKPEPKVEKKDSPDVNTLISKIYKDINNDESAKLLSTDARRELFFGKLEKLFIEEKLDESQIKSILSKDLASKMKDYHNTQRSGKPVIFDQDDFNSHVLKSIDALKGLETEWQSARTDLEKLTKLLEAKELEIDGQISHLKSIMEQHDKMERKTLVSNIPDRQSLIEEALPLGLASSGDMADLFEGAETIENSDDLDFDSQIRAVSNKELAYERILVLDKHIPTEHAFCFKGGLMVNSLEELKHSLSNISRDVLEYHLAGRHIHDWISTFFDDSVLLTRVDSLCSPEEFVDFFERVDLA